MTIIPLIYMFNHLFIPQMSMKFLLYAGNRVGTEDITANKAECSCCPAYCLVRKTCHQIMGDKRFQNRILGHCGSLW